MKGRGLTHISLYTCTKTKQEENKRRDQTKRERCLVRSSEPLILVVRWWLVRVWAGKGRERERRGKKGILKGEGGREEGEGGFFFLSYARVWDERCANGE